MTYQDKIRQFINDHASQDGLTDTGIDGVQLFRATQPMPCAPVLYEPCVVAIASGMKEVILDGNRYVYDNSQYLCCPMSMPVQAGTPSASPDDPLLGVYISLHPRAMTELTLEIDNAQATYKSINQDPAPQAIRLATWDSAFSDALWRLLQLIGRDTDRVVLGPARLRELHYAILKGEAGSFARQSFGVGNAIARSIAFVSDNMDKPVAIEDLADRAGMSRAVFHRKFRQATTMSPIQFVKSMRLNHAAKLMADGMNVSEAAMVVGYVSPSQFSREFKRLYGVPPKQWGEAQQGLTAVA